MKKSIALLLASVAVLGATAPVANKVLANDNSATYQPSSQKATSIAAELGRKYTLALANAKTAKQAHETASQALVYYQGVLETVKADEAEKVQNAQRAYDALVSEWNEAKILATQADEATGPGTKTELNNVNLLYGKPVQDAKDELEAAQKAAEKAIAAAQKAVDDAQKQADQTRADLDAAVAELEKAYNEFMNAGGKPEVKPAEVKPAEVKPAEVKPAEVKPEDKSKADEAAKKATEAAKKSEEGKKVLPKTSAAK